MDALPDTVKGTVAHFAPPPDAVRRADELAAPGWLVFPRYVAGAGAAFTPLSKGRALMCLIENAFNYNVHGRAGFERLVGLVDRVDCHTFTYSHLDDAAACFERLAAGASPLPT